jgi:hypothetical protein
MQRSFWAAVVAFGQTFTAPGSVLNSFSLFLRNRFSGFGINNATSPAQWTFMPWSQFVGQDDVWFQASFDLTPTPEPTTLLLWGTTMAGLGVAHRRRSRKSQ